MDARCALAMRGPETVGAGIAAADDDDVLVPGRDEAAVVNLVSLAPLILKREVIHREMDARQLPARNRKIARPRRAAGENNRVEALPQLVHRHVDADVGAGTEHHAFLGHQREPPLQLFLFALELGYAVAEQAADAIGALEHRDPMPRAIELCGCR